MPILPDKITLISSYFRGMHVIEVIELFSHGFFLACVIALYTNGYFLLFLMGRIGCPHHKKLVWKMSIWQVDVWGYCSAETNTHHPVTSMKITHEFKEETLIFFGSGDELNCCFSSPKCCSSRQKLSQFVVFSVRWICSYRSNVHEDSITAFVITTDLQISTSHTQAVAKV